MKIKTMFLAITAGAMLLVPFSAGAATIESDDGIVSIETPDESWVKTPDPNYDFVVTDGKSSITVDHLANGEQLPEVKVADANYKGVMQTYVSTPNEVFVVKGLAAEQADLESLMKIIGTLKVLKYDTKTSVATSETDAASDFGLRKINADYYCTGSEVSVRSSCSVDSSKIGELAKGDKIKVNGMVTKSGEDYGWYQVNYNGANAYVNASYLSADAPTSSTKTSSTPASTTPASTAPNIASGDYYVTCMFCGAQVLNSELQAHINNYHPEYNDQEDVDYVECPYCGMMLEAGNDYRNHVWAQHQAEAAADNEAGVEESDYVECPYCGMMLEAGNDYRNHVWAQHQAEAAADNEAGIE